MGRRVVLLLPPGLVLAVGLGAGIAIGAPRPRPVPPPRIVALLQCRSEKAAFGAVAFRQKYGTPGTMSACIRQAQG